MFLFMNSNHNGILSYFMMTVHKKKNLEFPMSLQYFFSGLL